MIRGTMPSNILTIPVTTQTPVIPLTVQSGDRIPFRVDDASAIPFKSEAGQQVQLYDLGNDIILDGGDADG